MARNYQMPNRQLVTQNPAAIIESARIPRSTYIGSWSRKTAFNMGYLVPCYLEEILPGDHLQLEMHCQARMATPLLPMFANLKLETFFFFVPARILWDNWEKFMGSQDNPTDSIAYTIPIVELSAGDDTADSIWDHMGIPVQMLAGANKHRINSLPFRAYNRIYNDWFRDQNLITKLPVYTGNGPDNKADFIVARRAKPHDYFTSALPWPQKFPGIVPSIPLAGSAPISGLGLDSLAAGAALGFYDTAHGTTPQSNANAAAWNSTGETIPGSAIVMARDGAGAPSIFADLSQATGASINSFRQAFMIQTMLERDARGGTRYTEVIFQQFGVRSPDYRLQRPEYVGGGVQSLNTTPVAQTVSTATEALGLLGGATAGAGYHKASYAATEHGYCIGLVNVQVEEGYQYGIRKLFSRTTRYDFFTPALAQLGEQAILRKEIYAVGSTNDALVFGYQERWHEYRTRTNEITGLMRSSATGTIDTWHTAQALTAFPSLDQTFIEMTPPTRILAAGATANHQQIVADMWFSQRFTRPLPMFSTPASIGRF